MRPLHGRTTHGAWGPVYSQLGLSAKCLELSCIVNGRIVISDPASFLSVSEKISIGGKLVLVALTRTGRGKGHGVKAR